ncbi:hypothetical protein G9A89_008609 [Geosiphon pyriformis]|nr:hypothetical protein G9A89_008609 [Geosiphon pyriformis]
MNNSAKQENVIRWHKKMNNLVSIITETKLRSKVCPWIADKFDGVQMFTSGLDSSHLGADVAVIMDVSLARHLCKISEAGEINSLIVKAVNESSFIVLGGDFNEDGSRKCASFRKCLDLGLANSLANSRGVKKTIDYVLVSSNLVNVIVHCSVSNIVEHFETNHQAVSMSLGLGGLLDVQLNSLCKQMNRDCWKFNFKGADDAKWNKFKCAIAANAAMFSDDFIASQQFSDLDVMWDIVYKIMLELLISKLVKASQLICHDGFILLLEVWSSLDDDNASVVRSLFLSGSPLDTVWSALSKIRKTYCSLKMTESKHVEESQIKSAIYKRIESFKLNKGHTIWSVLEHPSHKVILDHLVVDNELVMEPGLVRLRTRKYRVVPNVSDVWHCQYRPLDYVFDETFSGVIQPIEFLELFGMVSDLSVGKAAGLLVLIKTAHKILSKILSDRISLAYSAHDILHGDNFSVLKGTTTQTPIFAIGSVVENALEKNQEFWLVLQYMRKAYNSVGWEHLEKCLVKIKMCNKFIHFFGDIHRNRTNWVMTDFGLTDGYSVHDGLDQGEVFSPLLWRIFYDPLLCEVKHQESVYGYRLNSHFVFRNGRTEFRAGFSTFFAAGAFVNDTIWVGNNQTATQHILNIANEFFRINDISINNNKTVVISINSRISNPFLFISSSPISIAKKRGSHWYLGIFFSSDGLSKSSLAKVHLNSATERSSALSLSVCATSGML